MEQKELKEATKDFLEIFKSLLSDLVNVNIY